MSSQPEESIRSDGSSSGGGCIAGLLPAVSEAASLLLTVNNLDKVDEVLTKGLDIIGRAVNADRVFLWRDKQHPDEMIIEAIHSWSNEKGRNAPEVLLELSAPFANNNVWRGRFMGGECFGTTLSTMSPEEREFFSTFSTISVFFIPLFCSGTFWGMISIDNCSEERVYSDDEIIALKSICLMMASVINYQKSSLHLMSVYEKARAAGKVKNAFLSNMSHEVRTPLNAIMGMASVGRKASDNADKDNALLKIRDASAHLLDIISNVLDMAQIEEGKMELNPIEFAFRDMISKSLTVVKPLAAEKKQTLDIHIDDAIPSYVIGDNLRLQQLIGHLLSNAIKFTPIYGNISLSATLLSDAFEHIELQIVVADNGIGISDEQRAGIFTAFAQSHNALNRDYGGTGLGLPISKRIVELMDGHIDVESEPNQGTTVTLTIQLVRSTLNDTHPEDSDAANATRDEDEFITPGEFKGKRLLVVEDIEINREILIALLKDTELIIECAEDGQVAVDMVMFNVEKYDIVFMDLQMPNLGGLEATRQIRELPERKRGHLPIIAMTANVLAEDIKSCMEAGMDDHLCKPLDIEKVLACLRSYLCE